MMKNALLSLLLAAALVVGLATSGVMAEEESSCLECHEPTEDWAGMTGTEILAAAMDQEIKMHRDHGELTEEQLREIIATLLPEAD